MADAPAPELADLPDNWLEALLAGDGPTDRPMTAILRDALADERVAAPLVIVGCSCTGAEHEFRGEGCQYAGKPRPQLTPFSRTAITYASQAATGTCPDCSRPGVKVTAREVLGYGGKGMGTRGVRLGLSIELAAHKTPGRAAKGGGQVCAGEGKLPVGLRFTPSRFIAEWAQRHGARNVR